MVELIRHRKWNNGNWKNQVCCWVCVETSIWTFSKPIKLFGNFTHFSYKLLVLRQINRFQISYQYSRKYILINQLHVYKTGVTLSLLTNQLKAVLVWKTIINQFHFRISSKLVSWQIFHMALCDFMSLFTALVFF